MESNKKAAPATTKQAVAPKKAATAKVAKMQTPDQTSTARDMVDDLKEKAANFDWASLFLPTYRQDADGAVYRIENSTQLTSVRGRVADVGCGLMHETRVPAEHVILLLEQKAITAEEFNEIAREQLAFITAKI